MRLNLRLVQVSQFFQQFKLNVHHKPRKEHVILDVLSHFASANRPSIDIEYSKLDVLFVYNMMLIEIHLTLVS